MLDRLGLNKYIMLVPAAVPKAATELGTPQCIVWVFPFLKSLFDQVNALKMNEMDIYIRAIEFNCHPALERWISEWLSKILRRNKLADAAFNSALIYVNQVHFSPE